MLASIYRVRWTAGPGWARLGTVCKLAWESGERKGDTVSRWLSHLGEVCRSV